MRFAVPLLFTIVAFGQAPPRQDSTIALENAPAAETVKQMTAMLQIAANVTNVAFDEAHRSFTMRGPKNLLDLAAWLLQRADKPAGWRPPETDSEAENEYRLQPGGFAVDDRWPVARVHYLRNSGPRDEIQIMTILRVVADLQPGMWLEHPAMIAFRGTAADVALDDWIIGKLDLPAKAGAAAFQASDADSNRMKLAPKSDGSEDIVQVFYLNPALPAGTAARLGINIARTTNTKAFGKISQAPAVVVRGSSLVLAQAEQLIHYSTSQMKSAGQ